MPNPPHLFNMFVSFCVRCLPPSKYGAFFWRSQIKSTSKRPQDCRISAPWDDLPLSSAADTRVNSLLRISAVVPGRTFLYHASSGVCSSFFLITSILDIRLPAVSLAFLPKVAAISWVIVLFAGVDRGRERGTTACQAREQTEPLQHGKPSSIRRPRFDRPWTPDVVLMFTF